MRELIFVGALTLYAAACGAPEADRIEGDVSEVIERGIAEGTSSFDHSAWDALVREHAKVEGRRFDYAGLKEDEAAFDAYLDRVASANLAELGAKELQALFINAYNAYTVRTVLDHVTETGAYEIESIRDVPDVFGREAHVVGGFELSLDNIEHNILRPVFQDPRVHFAVNCASVSCPPLPTFALTANELDAQLERMTTSVLQSPDYVSVEGDALLLTKILEWYGGDFVNPEFEGAEASLPAFVRKYATDDVRAWIDAHASEGEVDDVPVRFRDYDWRLNRPAT